MWSSSKLVRVRSAHFEVDLLRSRHRAGASGAVWQQQVAGAHAQSQGRGIEGAW